MLSIEIAVAFYGETDVAADAAVGCVEGAVAGVEVDNADIVVDVDDAAADALPGGEAAVDASGEDADDAMA